MQHAIKQFTCTTCGMEALEAYQHNNPKELNEDEVQSLTLISRYQILKDSGDKEKVSQIECEFQKLYLSVNLTRLVAMKLIIFNMRGKEDDAQNKKQIKNVLNSPLLNNYMDKEVDSVTDDIVDTAPTSQPQVKESEVTSDLADILYNGENSGQEFKLKQSNAKKAISQEELELSAINPAIRLAAGRI